MVAYAPASHYQIYNLPAPTISGDGNAERLAKLLNDDEWPKWQAELSAAFERSGLLPKSTADELAEMSRRIQQIEAKRVLKSRSERSRLAPESQPIQDAIDAVLFRCYGLSEEEARYIEKQLEEML
jgi:hypothetical protein